jgi:hypothetical protein
LLAGLLDTDGYYCRGGYSITSEYNTLANQILFLARSLGLAAYLTKKEVKLPSWETSRTYNQISISGDFSLMYCLVPRKRANARKQIKRVTVTGWSAEYIGDGDYYGFTLTGNGRFLLGDFTITHNTYTGTEAVKYFPKGMRGQANIVFLAFNKAIQLEVEKKLGDNAIAKTYHSFGLSAIPRDKKLKITEYKNFDLLQAHFGSDLKPIFPLISKVTGLFKGDLRDDICHETVNEYISRYDLALGEEEEQYFDEIVEGVQLCMDPEHVERLGKIDFDDMIWYPLVRRFPFPSVDLLLVDEYQDSNESQMEMVFRAKNSHGRVVAIGDPRQAIYGWRGAGTHGMEIFAQRANATILPLTITYRCPKSVVQYTNATFPDIKFDAWDQAIEGSVNDVTEKQFFERVMPGDMVICRLNAPLVKPAMHLLREGKKVIIKGKDIGQNLITLINQVQKKFGSTNLNEFLADLDTYVAKESEKMRLTNRQAQADMLEDKQQTLYAFSEGADTVNDIKNTIINIFSNNQEGITFSSAHRAKGLEADNVYQLKPELFPFKRARTEEAIAQEWNLKYVACTRSKVSLNFVQG